MRVRGHHLACVYCYLGSGKRTGEEFFGLANAIPQLLEKLRADPDLEITVTDGLDEVCDICPLRRPRGCGRGSDPAVQNEKLRSWDRAILQRLGLKAGNKITAREVQTSMRRNISDIGEICTNCTSAASSGWAEYRDGISKGLWPGDGP